MGKQIKLHVWNGPFSALCVAFQNKHIGGIDCAVAPAIVKLGPVLVKTPVRLQAIAALLA